MKVEQEVKVGVAATTKKRFALMLSKIAITDTTLFDDSLTFLAVFSK